MKATKGTAKEMVVVSTASLSRERAQTVTYPTTSPMAIAATTA